MNTNFQTIFLQTSLLNKICYCAPKAVYNKERLYVTHSINQKLAAAPQFVKLLLGKYYD